MKKSEIENLLNTATESLFRNQPNLSDFTSETSETEWNLSHHLANEISQLFPRYDCDLDVTKRNHANKRPDIIIHTRGCNSNNLLVIEVKRDKMSTEKDQEKDIKKITGDWFRDPLCYRFGALIVMSQTGAEVEVVENPESIFNV